jgi:hypothetical protein
LQTTAAEEAVALNVMAAVQAKTVFARAFILHLLVLYSRTCNVSVAGPLNARPPQEFSAFRHERGRSHPR